MHVHRVSTVFLLFLVLILFPLSETTSPIVHASINDVVITSHSLSYYLPPTYQDWYSYIVGEVQNQGSDTVLFVGVTGTFFDSDGNILATDFEYVEIDVLAPDQTSPFLLQSWLPNVPADHYTVSVSQYDVTNETLYREFQIHNDALLYPKSNDYNPYVEGDVENTGQSDVNKCKVLVTLYNVEGTAIRTDSHIIVDMPVGTTRSFNFWFGSTPEISSYQIQVTTFAFTRRLMCTVASPAIPFGSNITVFGALIPDRVDTVTLNYTSPDGKFTLHNVTTSTDGYGYFHDTWMPARIGLWTVHASWAGDATYVGTTSPTQLFTVTKRPTDLTCSLSAPIIEQGQPVNITICLQPTYDTTIQITYYHDTEWRYLTSFNTTQEPCYIYSWVPPHNGSYSLNITCLGDAFQQTTTDGVNLRVKQSSVLNYQIDASITLSETLTISGTLNPALAGTTIVINYTSPSGQVITHEVPTIEAGKFSETMTPDTPGTWNVVLAWAGNDLYAGDVSQESFMVTEPLLSGTNILVVIAITSAGVLTFLRRRAIARSFRH
jgi:hypothetical protein